MPHFFLSLTIVVAFLFGSCQAQEKINYPRTNLTTADLIPMAQSIVPTYSGFGLRAHTQIKISSSDASWIELGNILSQKITEQTGLRLRLADRGQSYIELRQGPIENSNPEGYEIQISGQQLQIKSHTAAGAYRGIQTLLQLIPRYSNDTLTGKPIWVIPSGKITDAPQFTHRGMMLDVARHFFSVDEVKRLIDILAYYKYNSLHLHLSDDQGWRIEIKSWPKLTQIGGATEVGGGSSSYYTQQDFKEIVAYAKKHFIQIIPEIDMPGHTNAASLSYPELNGNGKKVQRYTGMKVGFSTLATRKEIVYKFLDDVVREISAISPSPYFHVGGDESNATAKNDYIYFVNRVQKIVQKYNKKMIGWNEIAQANLDPSSVVQFWSKADHARIAAAKGCKVILSPSKKAYLDMKYNKYSKHGLTWSGYITLATAYNWYPESYVSGMPSSSILGLEAPLWSETIDNGAELEYLAFPRAIAYAELGWTKQNRRRWDSFRRRLAAHQYFLDRHQVNYYPSPSINWK